jgi:Tfp pilus assembly protein PilN
LKVAGLSIEDSRIRASIVSKGIGPAKSLATDELTLPPNPEERNTVFKDALEKWKDSYGISGVVVGFGLSHFSHRTVELPVRSSEDIKNALVFEMEKYLPLEPDQYSLDFHTIESTKEGSNNIVLAIRKEKLRWIFDCLTEAGLKLLGAKCTALEAANELVSTVNISDALMVYPLDEAYQIVGLRGSNPELLRVAKTREEASAGIEKLLGSYGKALYVAGEKSAMEFDRFNPRTLPVNAANLVAATVTGRRQIKTDFAPEEFIAPKKDYYPYTLVLLCAACVAIFFSTTVLAYIKDYRALKLVTSRIEELRTETREVIESERKVSAAQENYRFLLKFKSGKNMKIRILVELSGILPRNAWLTSLSADEQGKLEIEGFADKAADIITPLENSPLLKDVEFSSPVTVKEGLERFSLKMQVEQTAKESGEK